MGDRYPKRSDLVDRQAGIEEDLRQQEIKDVEEAGGPAGGDLDGFYPDPTVIQTTMPRANKVRWYDDAADLATLFGEAYGDFEQWNEDFSSNPLPDFTRLYGSDVASYNVAGYVVGGGGVPNGDSIYAHSTKLLDSGQDLYMRSLGMGGGSDTGGSASPHALYYDPVSGWSLSCGYAYGSFSGNHWVSFTLVDGSGTFVSSDTQQLNFPGVLDSDHWTWLRKSGNVVTCSLHNGDPRTGAGAIVTATSTLTGVAATNLAGPLRPGFELGALHRMYVLGGRRLPYLYVALTADGTRVAKKLLRPDGTTELLPGASAIQELHLADGAVTYRKVNGALKPSSSAAATDESLRRLGTGSTHAAAGDDSRFPTTGEKNALAGTSGVPGSANAYVTNADARNSDQRTPPDGGVTTAKLADSSVTPAKMAASGVKASGRILSLASDLSFQWVDPPSGGGGASGHVIADEGTALTQRATLDFQGSAVTASDDAVNTKTIVTVAGAGDLVAAGAGPYSDALQALSPRHRWRLSERGVSRDAVDGGLATAIVGTYSGDPGLDRGQPGPIAREVSWAPEFSPYALTPARGKGYVSLASNPLAALSGNFTFLAWILWRSTGSSWQRVFDLGTAAGSSTWLTPSNGAGMFFQVDAAGSWGFVSPAATPTLRWLFVAITCVAGTNGAKMYQDGVQVAQTTPGTARPSLSGGTSNFIGHSPSVSDFDFAGRIAEVALFDVALSAAQISNLYDKARGL